MNTYKNLEASKKMDQNFENNKKEIKIFNFLQPKNAQLISTSLGINNQILLRFIYKGDNVLVLLDSSSNEVISIITLKKELDKW